MIRIWRNELKKYTLLIALCVCSGAKVSFADIITLNFTGTWIQVGSTATQDFTQGDNFTGEIKYSTQIPQDSSSRQFVGHYWDTGSDNVNYIID
jgi:hypothetical protein